MICYYQEVRPNAGTYGGSRFSRIPTVSSSASSSARCSARFVASRIIRMRSLVYNPLADTPTPRGVKKLLTYFSSRNDLSTSTFTFGSTLNNTRQVENLNLCASIVKHTRDSRECRERVCSNLTLRPRDFRQKRRFSD